MLFQILWSFTGRQVVLEEFYKNKIKQERKSRPTRAVCGLLWSMDELGKKKTSLDHR
jgi:hypothetical protein